MRALLLTIMVAVPTIAAFFLVVLTITYHRFRRIVPELRTPEDLQRLRSLAKFQMYVSLLGHPLVTIGGPIVIWVVGWLLVKKLGWVDLLVYGVLPMIVPLVIAAMGESPARMAKGIPASEASLASERDRIVDVWINRLFPDW
jgi:hypothetical protein